MMDEQYEGFVIAGCHSWRIVYKRPGQRDVTLIRDLPNEHWAAHIIEVLRNKERSMIYEWIDNIERARHNRQVRFNEMNMDW